MKYILSCLLVGLIFLSSCKTTKKEAFTAIEDFEISQMHRDAANYMNMSTTKKSEYFDLLRYTSKGLKLIKESGAVGNEKTQQLKDLYDIHHAQLRDFFNEKDYVKYVKYLKNYNADKPTAKEKEQLMKKGDKKNRL